jgi:hypothetical protein
MASDAATGAARARETAGPWRDDLVTALCATALVFGLFLDGWNHINLQNGALGGFFTFWHGLLYAGFTATALWVMTRNPHLYLRDRRPEPHYQELLGVPLRYPFAVAGLGIATIGLFGDLVWHEVFGEETGVARVISPFHLFLFTGAGLLIAAPLRSAWHAPEYYPPTLSWRMFLPPLLSLTLLSALVAFLFQWLSAFVDWQPSLAIDRVPAELAAREDVNGTVEFAGVARVIVTNLVLLAPVLLALRRWRPPFGSITFLFTSVALLMSALSELNLGGTVLAAAVGGLAADLLIARLRPSPGNLPAYRIVAGATPLVLWSAYFLALWLFHDIAWPRDLWLGTVGLASVTGLALSFFAIPPAVGDAPKSSTAPPGHR